MSPESEEPPAADPGATRTNLDPVAQLAAGARLAGRYRIRRMLGIGGMGMVYLADDEELELPVAIKTLRPEAAGRAELLERFRRELVLARQVSHRNVVRIHDVGQDGDLYFISMDYVEGRTLQDLLRQEGALPAERAAEIGRQLAEALAAAHDEGVVHRDLKPSNVMIDRSGRALITDFGVARSVGTVGLTRTGGIVGTPDYLSPEQAAGEQVDGRSDIYALGIMLFEMVTGELPFAGGSITETMAQRIAGRPSRLDRLEGRAPAGLQTVVRRCLEPSPARRYGSAAEVARDLSDLSAVRPPRDWRRLAAVAALAVALLAVAAAGWWWWQRQPAEPRAGPAGGGGAPAQAIALLPLVDQSGTPRLAWLAAAVPEILAEVLSENRNLRVADGRRIARTIRDLKLGEGPWDEAELRQIAELFDVDRLLTGAVRAGDGEVWLDARLRSREPAGGFRSQPLEARAAESELPGGLVEQLAAALRRELELAEPSANPLASGSPAALRAYGEGVRFLSRGDAASAAPLLESATEADPAFGAAWLQLSTAYSELGSWSEAESAAERAVEALGRQPGRLADASRARLALLRGEPETAVEILSRLEQSYPNDVESALALADAYGELGEHGRAVQTLEKVTRLAPNHPRAWFEIAKNSILNGDSRTAIDDYLVRAMVIQNRLRNDQGRADVLNAFGVAHRAQGELDLAADYYRQAADLRQQLGDRRGYATSLRNLAQVDSYRGDFAAAEASLDRALEILRELDDQAGVADLHNERGVLEEERGRNRAALDQYRRALKLRRDLGDRRAEAESLNNVGYAYYLLGEYDNASVYWRQALELYRATDNPRGEALATQSLGQLQLAQGDWNEAVQSFLAALEISREIDFTPASAVSLGYLGRLAQYQGRYAAALASYDEALAVTDELDDARGRAEFTLARAETLAEVGASGEAAAELERAAETLAGSSNHEQLATLERLRFELGGGPARLERARREASASASPAVALEVELAAARVGSPPPRRAAELVEEARELGNARLQLLAGEQLAGARLREGDDAGALRALEELFDLVDGCGSWAGAHRLYDLRARAQEARGEAEAAAASRERAEAERRRIAGDLPATLQRAASGE